MRYIDVYDTLLGQGRGILTGCEQRNGVILYGRVGKEITELPDMLTRRYKKDIEKHEYRLFTFDIFAVQFRPGDLFAACGRVAVLCNSAQKEHEITALACKLFYNRIMGISSVEANLVVGCYFDNSTGKYSLEPAVPVSSYAFSIKSDEKQLFIDNMLLPTRMTSLVDDMFPHKLGNECPMLNGSSLPMPAFFEAASCDGCVHLKQSLATLYRTIKYPNLCEDYNGWTASPSIERFFNYKDIIKRRRAFDTFLELSDVPPIVTDIQTKLVELEASFKATRSQVLADPPQGYLDQIDVLADTVKSLLRDNWLSDALGRTGKRYIVAMLRVLITNSDVELKRVENDIDALVSDSSVDDLLDTLFSEKTDTELFAFFDRHKLSVCKSLSLLAFIWAVLGIRAKYSSILEVGKSPEVLLYLILRKPYAITYIVPNISITTLDLLACFTGNASSMQSVIPLRSIAYLHSLLANPDNGSLLLERSSLNLISGYLFSAKELVVYQETRSLLNSIQCWISQQLFGVDIDNSLIEGTLEAGYDNTHILQYGVSVESMIGYYLNSGMGMQLESNGKVYLMDYDIAKQFVYCVSRLRSKFNTPVSGKIVDFNTLCTKYQDQKGITLEQEQALASKLLLHPFSCLTGSAGSGKTTTLDYLMYCIKEAAGVFDSEILLLAPTGMAAKRMRECTEHEASTIHSALRIFNTGINWDIDIKPSQDFRYRFVVVDETSMISLSLLYHMLKRIPDDVQILFIGDIAQLPPIDYGKPFADMLQFLPHVCLKTIKRASLTSGIVANCQALLSGNSNLITTRDTQVIQSKDSDAFVEEVADICKSLLGTTDIPYKLYNSDGTPVLTSAGCIQVVSPVSKASYGWSTIRLNDKLQDVFNPRKKGQNRVIYQDASRNDIELRVGDRVINSANDHQMFRYELRGDSDLVRLDKLGILNGEMGIIRAIEDASEFNFLRATEDGSPMPDDESVSMMSSSSRYTKVIVLVEFTDIDGNPFEVCYVGLLEGVFKNGVRLTSSYDLTHLSLAYAVTVHKMQGNQADYIIAPIFKTKARGFISRNLVNTAWSRAKKGLYIIGDVVGNYSAISSAMNIEALDQRLSPFNC